MLPLPLVAGHAFPQLPSSVPPYLPPGTQLIAPTLMPVPRPASPPGSSPRLPQAVVQPVQMSPRSNQAVLAQNGLNLPISAFPVASTMSVLPPRSSTASTVLQAYRPSTMTRGSSLSSLATRSRATSEVPGETPRPRGSFPALSSTALACASQAHKGDDTSSAGRRKPKQLSLDQEVVLRNIFQRCDANGDGRINKREMIKLCRSSPETAAMLGLPDHVSQEDGSRDQLEARFQAIDRDEDREITWDEFSQFFVTEMMGESSPTSTVPGNATPAFSNATPAFSTRTVDTMPHSLGAAVAQAVNLQRSKAQEQSEAEPSSFAEDLTRSPTPVAAKAETLRSQRTKSNLHDKFSAEEAAKAAELERERQRMREDWEKEQTEKERKEEERRERLRLEKEQLEKDMNEAWEKEWEAKHRERETTEARAKLLEAEAHMAKIKAAEKLLLELSDNPFELIPRASEVASASFISEFSEDPEKMQTDYASMLRHLHKESTRNLERLVHHVRSTLYPAPEAFEISTAGFGSSGQVSPAAQLSQGYPSRLYAATEASPAMSSQATAPLPEDWTAVLQHDMVHDMLIRGPEAFQGDAYNSSASGDARMKADWASTPMPASFGVPPAPSEPVAEPVAQATSPLPPEPETNVGGATSSLPGGLFPQGRRQLRVGADTMAGRKAHIPAWTNQDWSLTLPLGPSRLLVGVFDGHGEQGHEISSSVGALFAHFAHEALAQESADPKISGMPKALAQLFALAQQGLHRGGLADWSGTTATVAIIDAEAGVVVSAHVGDSRIVISHGPQVLFQSADHDVDEDASRRVVAAGGEVRRMTVSGVDARRIFFAGYDAPGLSMSRALGDLQASTIGVLSEPTINTCVELATGSAVIVASDGVWEKVSPEEAAAISFAALATEQGVDGRGAAASIAAKALVAEARSRWIQAGGDIDDITAVVVYLDSVADQDLSFSA